MLDLVDQALESTLRAMVSLPEEVEISFDSPDRDWGAGVMRPTINAFLWDVRVNAQERQAGLERVTDAAGRPGRRPPLPRVDCRYFVTAWTTDVRDEHGLLGVVLTGLLPQTVLAAEHLPAGLRGVEPDPTVRVATANGEQRADFWNALGGRLRLGLDVMVTATVDAAALVLAGGFVRQRRVDLLRLDEPRDDPGSSIGAVRPRGRRIGTDLGAGR